MPKFAIRSMIHAPPGYTLISLDLSQAEAWVVAYLAFDDKMKTALSKGDIHTLTGCMFFDIPYDSIEDTKTMADRGSITKEQRYTGKKGNHAFNYRMGPERAAQVINKEGIISVTVKQTKIYHKKYHEFYNLKGWWNDIESTIKATRTITTPYGFKRKFYGEWNDSLWKAATAFVPQSTIADHMFGAIQKENPHPGGLLEIKRQILDRTREIRATNTSHDSVILEVPVPIYKEIAEQAAGLLRRPMVVNGEEFTVPVDAEVGERWGQDMEKISL